MNVTMILVGMNIVVFALQFFIGGFTEAFALTPAAALDGAYWQFITYMFLHGGSMHIIINMIVLGIFGFGVENALGRERFLLLYFLSGLGSAFLYLVLVGNPLIMMLGASGAVFGVLAAYAILFPRHWIMVFFIPMPAFIAVIAITAFELVAGALNLLPGIANFGHLGGIITAAALMGFWKLTKKKVPLEDQEPRHFEFIWE